MRECIYLFSAHSDVHLLLGNLNIFINFIYFNKTCDWKITMKFSGL